MCCESTGALCAARVQLLLLLHSCRMLARRQRLTAVLLAEEAPALY
jgi:hypothetical protein